MHGSRQLKAFRPVGKNWIHRKSNKRKSGMALIASLAGQGLMMKIFSVVLEEHVGNWSITF